MLQDMQGMQGMGVVGHRAILVYMSEGTEEKANLYPQMPRSSREIDFL